MKDKRRGPTVMVRTKKQLEIGFNFSTIHPNGVLLWLSNNSYYFTIGLEKGHLKLATNLLAFNQSDGAQIGGFLADGGWHQIWIKISLDFIKLTLDNHSIFDEALNPQPGTFDLTIESSRSTAEDLIYLGNYSVRKIIKINSPGNLIYLCYPNATLYTTKMLS